LRPLVRKSASTGANHLVEIRNSLLDLSADAADEKILKWRHSLQEEGRTILEGAVALEQWGQKDVPLLHGRMSATE
jgi:hypothetical protein